MSTPYVIISFIILLGVDIHTYVEGRTMNTGRNASQIFLWRSTAAYNTSRFKKIMQHVLSPPAAKGGNVLVCQW